jgi:hypothetical protein
MFNLGTFQKRQLRINEQKQEALRIEKIKNLLLQGIREPPKTPKKKAQPKSERPTPDSDSSRAVFKPESPSLEEKRLHNYRQRICSFVSAMSREPIQVNDLKNERLVNQALFNQEMKGSR